MFNRRSVLPIALALALGACGSSSKPTAQRAISCSPPPAINVPAQPAVAASRKIGGAGTDPAYRGPLTNHGGPVQANPEVVLIFWKPAPFQEQVKAAAEKMMAYLPGSPWGRVLSQYGVHNDITLKGVCTDVDALPGGPLGYQAIQWEVSKVIAQSGTRPGLNVNWVVFLPPSANLNNFKNECGEHDSYGQTPTVYSLVQPFNTAQFGSGRASCVQYDAYGKSKVDATTSLLSHELDESATDPVQSNGGNGAGWWSDPAAKRFGMGAAEQEDVCYGQAVKPWGPNGPVVQAEYSNANQGPKANAGCVTSLAGGAPSFVGQTPGLTNHHVHPLPAANPAARQRLANS